MDHSSDPLEAVPSSLPGVKMICGLYATSQAQALFTRNSRADGESDQVKIQVQWFAFVWEDRLSGMDGQTASVVQVQVCSVKA